MRGSTFTEKFVLFLVIAVGLGFLNARPAAAETGVVWGMSINQEDIKPNPPFAPSIHFVHNNERVGSWDASRSRDLCAPIGDIWEFQPNPVGLNPKDITRMAVSFNWDDWVQGTREANGWVVRVNSADKSIIPIAGIEYTPVMAVEGKIGEKVVRFIFTFRWKTNQEVFSALKIMAWETPGGYATMSRKRAFLYYEGVKQSWSAVASPEADAALALAEVPTATPSPAGAPTLIRLPQPVLLPTPPLLTTPTSLAVARLQQVLAKYPSPVGKAKVGLVVYTPTGAATTTFRGQPAIVDVFFCGTLWKSYTLVSASPDEAGILTWDVDPGTVLQFRVRGDAKVYTSAPAAVTGPSIVHIQFGR